MFSTVFLVQNPTHTRTHRNEGAKRTDKKLPAHNVNLIHVSSIAQLTVQSLVKRFQKEKDQTICKNVNWSFHNVYCTYSISRLLSADE